MNRTELVAAIAEKSGLSKTNSERALKALLDTIQEALVNNDKVQLTGFGSFEVIERKARIGRNPKTNEEMPIPGGKAPKFKAGKLLRDAVKGDN